MAEGVTRPDDTIVLSVHGPAGVLDMVVPGQATAVDVARAYADETGGGGVPLLQTSLGGVLAAGIPLVESGVRPGDLLVVTQGVRRPVSALGPDPGPAATESPALASLVCSLAAVLAPLAGSYAARSGDDGIGSVVVVVLLLSALAAVLPWGRHRTQRAAAAPAFGGAAAFVALHPHVADRPLIVGCSALAAAGVAVLARLLARRPDEVLKVWAASGAVVFAAGSLGVVLGSDAQVTWALLLVLAMLAARLAPSLSITVADEALLDLERMAVTAWSARDQVSGNRRSRAVTAGGGVARLAHRAARSITASSVAVLVVVGAAAPLLLHGATVDLDRLGARILVALVGASLLLTARAYRHRAARVLLRSAGLAAWAALALHLVDGGGVSYVLWFVATVVVLGLGVVVAAVATGRGWRSVWWSRRADVAEMLCGSAALGAAVVATGLFRSLWELTS